MAFIDEVIPFANKDQATVYEHLKARRGLFDEASGAAWSAGRTLCGLE